MNKTTTFPNLQMDWINTFSRGQLVVSNSLKFPTLKIRLGRNLAIFMVYAMKKHNDS